MLLLALLLEPDLVVPCIYLVVVCLNAAGLFLSSVADLEVASLVLTAEHLYLLNLRSNRSKCLLRVANCELTNEHVVVLGSVVETDTDHCDLVARLQTELVESSGECCPLAELLSCRDSNLLVLCELALESYEQLSVCVELVAHLICKRDVV